MKLWVEFNYSWLFKEEDVWLSIGGYKRLQANYFLYVLHINVFKWIIVINFVNNKEAYKTHMNDMQEKRKRYLTNLRKK